MAHHQYVDEQDTVDDPASVPLRLSLLGRVRLSFRGPAGVADIALEPKQRTLLTCLALHREGQRRDAVIATIWADARADRYPNRLHAQLNLIRKALRKHTDGAVQEMVCHDGAYYGLDPAVVSVDLWDLQNTLRTAPTSAQVTSLYRGPLAADLAAPWIEAHRQHLHQDVVAALHQQARAAEDDPERQLEILDELRRLDPHNEDTYRAIARTQARLERHEAIGDTLARLTTSLAEIGERPSRDIIDYCKSLRERRTV